jgi:hypothetical protein
MLATGHPAFRWLITGEALENHDFFDVASRGAWPHQGVSKNDHLTQAAYGAAIHRNAYQIVKSAGFGIFCGAHSGSAPITAWRL